MPLLRKQPFQKIKPPADLRLDEEVFHCKITNEIFRDYDAFFERIILCNSLVWSCGITGRSGMTYQEAEDCEDKAKRHLATFQDSLQRPLLFIATLTYRSRLVDLNDDVFLFAKDRFFIGETVDVLIGGERKASKIVKVVPPADTSSKTNGDVIVIDEDSDSGDEKRELPSADKMMYIVHPSSGKNNRVMVKASQVSRKKGLYTRDKSKLFLKQHCESVNGVWSIKETVKRKLHLSEARYEDFYTGPRPCFSVSVIKKKNVGKKSIEKTATPVAATTPKTSTTNNTPSTSKGSAASSKSSSPSESVPSPQSSLTPAERAARKEQERLEKLAEKLAKQQEIKQKIEEEKQRRKEEREKERLKKREEKKKQMEQLKEWSRPREDLDCDDHKPLPEFKELKSKLPTRIFGEAVMVLEYLNAFKSIFDFKQFFPKGFTWSQLEMALLESDPQGPLCDLIQMLLCTLFNLQEEEAEEYHELEKEQRDEVEKKPHTAHAGEEEQTEEDDCVSNNELIRSASVYAQFSQHTFGMPLRDTLLDQFTLTEILRLHLMASGARANAKNARFRYQQRGGYSSLDDPGLDLRKQEPMLMKKLQSGNVFDFTPDEKMKLVSTLVQQVMTYAAVRDIVEDTYDKLRVKKYDLKLLQWAEVRRIREDQVANYKRQMEEKVKEREHRLKELARAQQIKQAAEQGMEAPELPPLEDPLESAEDRQRREQREQQEEAKKRADYHRRELDTLNSIVEMQRTNALYPMGRDRHYRRYWLFSSLPAVMVEDHELFLSPLAVPVTPAHQAGEEEKGDMPTLTRQEEHNTSSDKENELSGKAAACDGVNGKVKDDDCIVISDGEDSEGKTKDGGEVVPLMSESDKGVDTAGEQDSQVGESGERKVKEEEAEDSSPPLEREPPKLDSLPLEHILQEKEPRWYVMHSKDCLQDLMAALNPRGFRESALHAVLQDFRPLLEVMIGSCPTDVLHFSPATEDGAAAPKAQVLTRSTTPKTVEGSTQSDSASEAMELTLRDALLDLEDRIFVGSLGCMKVKDRSIWRSVLENGGYSCQTDESPFCNVQSPKKDGTKIEASVQIPEEVVARDMAHALVQISRGVESRFLTTPLAGALYERWEESMLGCSSLSQVFLHLAALDKSIKWDRSALLARCRICRRKGDAEKMLLCDKCDRGHHMYCLKPPMTKVPPGDWFCPNCKPKLPAQSPRKNRRRTFSEVEEEEEEEESLQLEETIEEASEDDDEQMEEEEVEEEEAEEEEDSDEEEENEDMCSVCHEDGKLILCDVCPRSYHLHCARPPLKKVPKGKWMCQVCVGGGRAGKIQLGKHASSNKAKESSGKKDTPKGQGSGKGSKSSSHPGSRRETPRNSPTPTAGRPRKDASSSREVTPRSGGHKGRGRNHVDKDSTPKSWNGPSSKLKRNSSSSRLSNDGDFETSARHYTSSKRGNTQVLQMKAAEDLLQELIRHSDAWPFLKPVDKKLVPDYYEVIEHPMDLSTIRNKVHRFAYATPGQLLDDMRLILANCVEYNARTTQEYRAGQSLAKFFHSRLRDLGLTDTSPNPPPAKKQRR